MKTLAEYKYFETANGTLYHGDAADILPLITEPVNLVLTEPPYGIDACKGFNGAGGFNGSGAPIKRRQYAGGWDGARASADIINMILKYPCIIFGGNYYTDILPQNNHWLIWDKQNTMPTFSDAELAYTNIKKNSVKKYTVISNGCLGEKDERVHPTQKPVKLISLIMADYTKEGETVLDAFMGSGTLGVSAERMGRRWLGIERDADFIKVAAERIDAEARQAKLF